MRCGQQPQDDESEPEQCPPWCAGGHHLLEPEDDFLHASEPEIVLVRGGGDERFTREPLEVWIESCVPHSADTTAPGVITWAFNGTSGPVLTTEEAQALVASLTMLIVRLERGDRHSGSMD